MGLRDQVLRQGLKCCAIASTAERNDPPAKTAK